MGRMRHDNDAIGRKGGEDWLGHGVERVLEQAMQRQRPVARVKVLLESSGGSDALLQLLGTKRHIIAHQCSICLTTKFIDA